MQTNQPFIYEEKQLKDRLEKLNKDSIVVFSARCALRVFPLLAQTSYPNTNSFSYWPEIHKAKHLLSIWKVLLLIANYNKTKYSCSKNNALSIAFAANSIINSDLNEAAFAAVRTSFSAATVASENRLLAQHACNTAKEAHNAINKAQDFFPNNFQEQEAQEKDLFFLENNEASSLVISPLWPNHNLKNIDEWLKKTFDKGIKDLSSEQKYYSTDIGINIINDIYSIYMSIFQGKPDQKSIDNALDQLQEYFSNKNIEEKENNKPFYDKDDAPFYGKDDKLFYKKENEPNSEVDPAPKPEETEHDIETIAGNRHSSHQYAAEDKLNRQHLVNTLAALLQNQNNHHHQTIGLLGHWGVGKTSVVELLKTTLQTKKNTDTPDFLFAEFNAWEYEHTDNLQAGIAQEMIKALSSPMSGATKDGWGKKNLEQSNLAIY